MPSFLPDGSEAPSPYAAPFQGWTPGLPAPKPRFRSGENLRTFEIVGPNAQDAPSDQGSGKLDGPIIYGIPPQRVPPSVAPLPDAPDPETQQETHQYFDWLFNDPEAAKAFQQQPGAQEIAKLGPEPLDGFYNAANASYLSSAFKLPDPGVASPLLESAYTKSNELPPLKGKALFEHFGKEIEEEKQAQLKRFNDLPSNIVDLLTRGPDEASTGLEVANALATQMMQHPESDWTPILDEANAIAEKRGVQASFGRQLRDAIPRRIGGWVNSSVMLAEQIQIEKDLAYLDRKEKYGIGDEIEVPEHMEPGWARAAAATAIQSQAGSPFGVAGVVGPSTAVRNPLADLPTDQIPAKRAELIARNKLIKLTRRLQDFGEHRADPNESSGSGIVPMLKNTTVGLVSDIPVMTLSATGLGAIVAAPLLGTEDANRFLLDHEGLSPSMAAVMSAVSGSAKAYLYRLKVEGLLGRLPGVENYLKRLDSVTWWKRLATLAGVRYGAMVTVNEATAMVDPIVKGFFYLLGVPIPGLSAKKEGENLLAQQEGILFSSAILAAIPTALDVGREARSALRSRKMASDAPLNTEDWPSSGSDTTSPKNQEIPSGSQENRDATFDAQRSDRSDRLTTFEESESSSAQGDSHAESHPIIDKIAAKVNKFGISVVPLFDEEKTQSSAGHNAGGNITIGIHIPRLLREEKKAQNLGYPIEEAAEVKAGEETVHAAHQLIVKDLWDKAGRPNQMIVRDGDVLVGFQSFFRLHVEELSKDLRTTVEQGSASEQRELKQAMADALNLYYGDRSSAAIKAAPENVFEEMKSVSKGETGFMMEFIRQIVQIRRQNKISESFFAKIASKCADWVERALEYIRQTPAWADQGRFGEGLRKEVENIHKKLDEIERSSSDKNQ